MFGNIDAVTNINGEERYDRINGWFYDPIAKRPPASLFFVDQNYNIIGYALTGQQRSDVASFIKTKKTKDAGFKGYILANSVKGSISLLGNNPSCSFNSFRF